MRYSDEGKRSLVLCYQNGKSADHICAEIGMIRSTFKITAYRISPHNNTKLISIAFRQSYAEGRVLFRQKQSEKSG